jgi:hypothetical protein
MHETYRMLGSEHENDLERHAANWRRGAEVRRQQPVTTGLRVFLRPVFMRIPGFRGRRVHPRPSGFVYRARR